MAIALRLGLGLGLALSLTAGPAMASPPTSSATPLAGEFSCRGLGPTIWPSSALQRRGAIERMEVARLACMDDAFFLSLLGALLLEDGDSEQALLWLERSLLLDPNNLGAQADFAIAWAARGDMGPLQALAAAWRERADIPGKLRARLDAVLTPDSRYALPTIRFGLLSPRATWGAQGEATFLVGHETNLDRSPRLSELTLTIPDGSIVLPVEGAVRAGPVVTTGLAYRWAYAPNAHWVLSSAASGLSRYSDAHPSTNWQQYQWAGNVVHQQEAWRTQLDISSVWVRGPLGEPFRQLRAGFAADLTFGPCRLRAGGDSEQRTQSDSRELDASYRGASLGLQCNPGTPGLQLALAVRSGKDRPEDPDRPGGEQKIDGAAMHLSALVMHTIRVQTGLRYTRSRDATGYSVLLDNGAIRVMHLKQLSIEAAMPLAVSGLDLLLQWQSALQRSNLPLFSYRAHSAYMGLRYLW